MSVIIRNTSGGGGSNGSGKGFPPGDVSNIKVKNTGSGTVHITWNDPDNTTLEDSTIISWSKTVIVMKQGSIPNSPKDGTIVCTNTTRNNYSSNPLEITGLTINVMYYFRFYTISNNDVYNDSNNMIGSVKTLNSAPILKDNTWEQISGASESGSIPSTWKVGDEIDITLSGTYNETLTLQIWDFNHYDKTDGTGKAGIVFGCKNLMKNTDKMNGNDTNNGGWNKCYMRNTVMNNIYNSMPNDLKSIIKEVTTSCNIGGKQKSSRTCNDKIFLPSINELFTNSEGWNNYDGNYGSTKFPIFTNNKSRIKKLSNGSGSSEYYWTRSPNSGNSYSFCGVFSDGSYDYYDASYGYGVCFCFCV